MEPVVLHFYPEEDCSRAVETVGIMMNYLSLREIIRSSLQLSIIMYSCMYDEILMLFRRAALQKWKQKHGTEATYNNLIQVFKKAEYKDYAVFVKSLANDVQTETEHSNRNAINQTPPTPLKPVTSVPEQFSKSRLYATVAGVKFVKEDYEPGTKEVVNIIHNNNVIISLPMMILAILLRSYLLLPLYYTIQLLFM